ncbi:hypothetical protein CCHL11_05787 [Colletotrichum chlorophyti]|uniref:Rhodopsin domain-containing protein n=1 Tax=Colletotrichum chlorophyti TaxID=708187 RepID=A0A1Q8RN73_9PEZI|nr:hypothetical protein CCHL11_05787 [Colletotrichum chlorophyti]
MSVSMLASEYQGSNIGRPNRQGVEHTILIWLMFTLTVFAVVARILPKTPLFNSTFIISADDWVILFSMALVITEDVTSQVAIGLGVGRDTSQVPLSNLRQILLIFFVEEILYVILVMITKISIILFYLRIFYETWFRRACYAILIIIIFFGIFYELVVVSASSHGWPFWDGQDTGKRGDEVILSYVNSGINIAMDLCLCFLPVTQFISVSWTTRKKIGTSLIFLVGLFNDRDGWQSEPISRCPNDCHMVHRGNPYECHMCLYARDDGLGPSSLTTLAVSRTEGTSTSQEQASNGQIQSTPGQPLDIPHNSSDLDRSYIFEQFPDKGEL